MRLLYIANIRLPTEKAHGIQIMKTCEALAKAGVRVELVVPKRRNSITEDPFDFYGAVRTFEIKRLWSLDLMWLPILKRWTFWKQSATFALRVLVYLRGRIQSVILYTRDLLLALTLPKGNLFYEVHWLPERVRWYHRRAYKRVKGLVVISEGIRNDLLKLGIPDEKICVARDAVDLKQFQIDISKEEARRKLSLPVEQKIAVYTGHLYEWKGADVLAKAALLLPQDVHVYIVGGTKEDVENFRTKYHAPNLHIVGWQRHKLIPYWLKAADILVLPNSAKSGIGAMYTSPLKAFEYRASRHPIVASDVPALRELLNDADRVMFVQPDNPDDLALGLKRLITVEKEIQPLGLRDYQRDSWDTRAEKILSFVT